MALSTYVPRVRSLHASMAALKSFQRNYGTGTDNKQYITLKWFPACLFLYWYTLTQKLAMSRSRSCSVLDLYLVLMTLLQAVSMEGWHSYNGFPMYQLPYWL